MISSQRRSGEQTHTKLVEAAASAFSRHGFHGTTTAEIAAAAGCSEPTLFKHFRSKHALLTAALEERAAQLMAQLDAPLDPGTDPYAAFSERARSLLVDPRLGELSRLRNFALTVTDEPVLGEGTLASLNTFLQRVADTVAAGQKSGAVRDDVDPADVAQLVHALSLLFGVRSALAGDEEAAKQVSPVVDTLATLLRVPQRS